MTPTEATALPLPFTVRWHDGRWRWGTVVELTRSTNHSRVAVVRTEGGEVVRKQLKSIVLSVRGGGAPVSKTSRRDLLAFVPLVRVTQVSWLSTDDYSIEDGVEITEERSDVPEFKRVYRKKLDNRARIEIEIKMFLNSLFKSGTLMTQPDERRVYFEPDRIANKIIDPILVPLVESAVKKIYKIDREWRKGRPNEFVDKSGTKWRRVEAAS